MKYEFIQAHRFAFAVKKMCKVLRVSRSGYYDFVVRPESRLSIENKVLVKEIKSIHKESRKTYGSPRIADELNDRGFACSRPRTARLMRKHNIYAKTKRKYKVTTNSDHNYRVAPNLLKQEFWTNAPNRIWVGDITYIRTWQGLTVILDLFNRKVVGWSMSERLTANTTTIPAFIQAVKQYQPSQGLIFHSDRGVQYACGDYRELMELFNVIQSMSGRGNCYDNAVAESFFHTLKTELVYHETYRTHMEAKNSLFEYMEVFYNRVRKHSALGYKSPEQYEQSIFKQAI